MFPATFRNTFKTLFRSVTFWLFVGLLTFMLVRFGLSDYKIYAPGYEPTKLFFDKYTGFVGNLVTAELLRYAIPVFTVVLTALILNRDHGDNFFEIEKSGGAGMLCYLAGRVCALAAVVFAVQAVVSFLSMYIYVGRWGGVADMTAGKFFLDSTVRLLRLEICVALPNILFYLGLTYLLGTIFHSGTASAVCGLGVAAADYVFSLMYRNHDFPTYFGYFSPRPDKLAMYFFFMDTPDELLCWGIMGTSLSRALLALTWLIGFFLCCSVGSYCLLRRREL